MGNGARGCGGVSLPMQPTRLCFLAATLLALQSCHSIGVQDSEWSEVRFARLASSGEEVEINGYAATGPEDSGIYPRKAGFYGRNQACLFMRRVDLAEAGVKYGDRVKVSGRIRVSPCKKELICLTVCRDYLIEPREISRK